MKKRAYPLEIYNKLLFGRNEWCALPGLNLPAIKAKIDTGAKTSAIHAYNITTRVEGSKTSVDFCVHPLQGNDSFHVFCSAEVVDERYIMSSNGHKEHRYVIKTPILVGDLQWEIEVTLSNRDPLKYRMLLGRESLAGKVLVDPQLACHQGKKASRLVNKLYNSNQLG